MVACTSLSTNRSSVFILATSTNSNFNFHINLAGFALQVPLVSEGHGNFLLPLTSGFYF